MNAFTLTRDLDPLHVLVAASDLAASADILAFLEGRGIQASVAATRGDLARLMSRHEIDAVVLDQHLGADDAMDVLRDIRAASDVPVVVTGAPHAEEIDRILGLETGADDFVTRPFSMRELLARIRAVRRRCAGVTVTARPKYKRYAFEGWLFDQRQRSLRDPLGRELEVSKSDFALLSAFVAAPRRVLSREHLLQATRRHEDIFDRSVDVQVLRLRRKLGDDPRNPRLIRTARGVGYAFETDVKVALAA